MAGPGFINLRVAASAKQSVVRTILKSGAQYGRSNAGAGKKVVIEFVSANPTGPLHVGHGRQAALGDALSALFDRRAMRSPASSTTTTPASRSPRWPTRCRRA